MTKRLTLAALILGFGMAPASEEAIRTVLQPLATSGGDVLGAATYIGYTLDWTNPACELLLTVRPNLVWVDGQAKDRNAAALAGIKFESMARPPTDAPGAQGDALRVVVDVSALVPGERPAQDSDHLLVTSTLWCGLRNAKCRWPVVRFVEYTVRGSEEFGAYTGVYSLENVEPASSVQQLSGWGPAFLRELSGE